MIVQVTPDHAALMWGALHPLFERVTRHTNGCYEPADVLREILNGQQTLWVAWDQERNVVDAAIPVLPTSIVPPALLVNVPPRANVLPPPPKI